MTATTNAIKVRVNSIKKIDERLAKLREQEKMLTTSKDKLVKETLGFFAKAEVDQVKFDNFTVSVKELEVPSLKDFNKVWNFAVKNDAPELFQRRINSKSWREHDMKVPGVEVFVKRSLSIRSR